MKQSFTQKSKSLTKQSKQTSGNRSIISNATKKQQQKKGPPINTITKENYDVMHKKQNITQIEQLKVKYVLRCIGGIFINKFLYITTHKQGQVIGSGDAKTQGLTLQIQGVGLSSKHAKLKFSGFKKFYVKDFGSQKGTWLNISKQGTEIKDGETYLIGQHQLYFELSCVVDEIEQICMVYDMNSMSQLLKYNNIHNLSQLYKAQYQNFKTYPFDENQINFLNEICEKTKNWYDETNIYKRVNLTYLNDPIKQMSIEVGWVPYQIPTSPEDIFSGQDSLATIERGKIIPREKVYSKILPMKNYKISLHDQIKIGDLIFQLNRFNLGYGQNIGYRSEMQDCYIVQEDVGGSEWKLISLFGVIDGYGGKECVQFIKQKLVQKVREWTSLLDQAGDINQMMKLLMSKTFYEIDHEYYQAFNEEITHQCGATLVCLLVIDCRAYVFNLGDCKGYLYRSQKIYQLTLDHLPSRADQKTRIEKMGGFIQYNRLMGKCTLSRAMGQFQFKDLQDYTNHMKGKLKSYISCTPQVIAFDIQSDTDDYIFLTTDGILNALGEGQIINYINEKSLTLETQYPSKIVSSMMENSKLAQPQCDNMAAILIFIRKGKVGAKISW